MLGDVKRRRAVDGAGPTARAPPAGEPSDAAPHPRLRGDRRHHLLHQHVEPLGDAGAGLVRPQGGRKRSSASRGSRPAWRSQVVTGLLRGRPDGRPRGAASTWSATAARPASATRGRCPTKSRRSSEGDLVVASVLSGNRNFEGRVNPAVRPTTWPRRRWSSPTRSPAPWTSTFASRSLGTDTDGAAGLPARHLADDRGGRQWRHPRSREQFVERYAHVFEGDDGGAGRCPAATRSPGTTPRPTSAGRPTSTASPSRRRCRHPRRSRAGDPRRLGHHRPHLAGRQHPQAARPRPVPAAHGVQPTDYNQYGARRGNHEVMVRGTFANIRIKNLMLPGVEGGDTAT